MSLMAPAYDTEADADAAPATRDSSQACDRGRHDDCPVSHGPTKITAGPRAGRWLAAWVCACACHHRRR